MRFLFFFLLAFSAVAQVSTEEVFPTGDKEITIIFNLKLAKDSRASALLGKKNDVYLWSGAGDSETGDAFKYQPAGQNNFSVPFEKGAMTFLGDDKWSIKLTPRTYFGVPNGVKIVRLGVLLKSGDGKAQTEDFFLNLYTGNFAVKWLEPKDKFSLYEAGKTIPIRVKSSSNATLNLKTSNTLLTTTSNTDSLSYQLVLGPEKGKKISLVLEADNGSTKLLDSIQVMSYPEQVVEALPAGIKDGINYQGNRVILSFYAPKTSFVYVIGEFNNWQMSANYLMKKSPDGVRYWLDLGEFPTNQEIAYQYVVDGKLAVADPLTEKILDPSNDKFISSNTYPNLKSYPSGASGIVSVFQTGQAAYPWKITNFKRPAQKDLYVYELLVRDFLADKKYKTIGDSIAYFKNLGINTIELMPVTEFTGNDSWGYNPIFYQAPDKAYGTSNDLKYLIDKCHENGIAVVMDMVFNQADYENPYVKMYWDGAKPSENSPFFNPTATHPFSVFYDFNHESVHTQWFVDQVIRFWIQNYKIDGIRFDLSKGFTQTNSGTNVDLWGRYDASRVKILKRIQQKIKEVDPGFYMILEHFADNNEENELGNAGMLLWGNAKFDLQKVLQGYTQTLSQLSYKNRGFDQPSVIGYMESHDEERQMVELQNGGRKAFSNAEKLDRIKLGLGTLLTVPGPKMIWQFGELGYDISINENGRTGMKPLKWEYRNDSERNKLFRFFQTLGTLRNSKSLFSTDNFNLSSVGPVKVHTLQNDSESLVYVANPDIANQYASINFPKTGVWYDYFSGKSFTIKQTDVVMNLAAGEFHFLTSQPWNTKDLGLVPWSLPDMTILGVSENSDKVKLFPNPSKDWVVVEWEGQENEEIQLHLVDIVGNSCWLKKVNQQVGLNQFKFSTEPLAPGMYFLGVQDRTIKLIVE